MQTHHNTEFSTKNINAAYSPIMICGGVFGNLEAFQAFFQVADRLSIKPENIIHTGDVFAYCGDPVANIELIAGSNINAIQGNVENSLLKHANDFDCRFAVNRKYTKSSKECFDFIDNKVSFQYRRYLSKLPHHITFQLYNKTIHVVHGSVDSINKRVYASYCDDFFSSQFNSCGADIIISGRGGIPFTRKVGNNIWHNPGNLGMPANDGTSRVWYSIAYPDERNGLRFEHHSLDYNFEKTINKMALHNLPIDYFTSLRTGLWPSLDVLPSLEREQTGVALIADQLQTDTPQVYNRHQHEVESLSF